MTGLFSPVQPGSEGCPPKMCADEVGDEDEGQVWEGPGWYQMVELMRAQATDTPDRVLISREPLEDRSPGREVCVKRFPPMQCTMSFRYPLRSVNGGRQSE